MGGEWGFSSSRVVLITAAVLLALAAGASAAVRQVSVFPIPGSRLATPQTQISFRGVAPGSIGAITVVGSRTGSHPGTLRSDSDGRGASFYPARPFVAGEVVTVRTKLPIVSSGGGTFQFTIERPEPPVRPALPVAAPRVRGDVDSFRSQPDLTPASVRIRRGYSGAADIFLTSMRGPLQWGPMIVDRWGHLVWFDKLPTVTSVASDFTEQRYHGQSVLTWWQGFVHGGFGQGEDVIFDHHYDQIATIHAGNGLAADLHEFYLTSQGTALITAYTPVHWDGSSIGASSDQNVLNCTVQEIDIHTGNVLFQWDSLDHVPIHDSYWHPSKNAGIPFDYFHVNSVQQDTDGNLIVSARNTWAVYKVDHGTGAVEWELGGKHSSFKMGRGTVTAYQHDATIHPGGLMTIFDDGASPRVHPQSRVVLERINTGKHTVTLVRELDHSPGVVARYEGSAQLLGNGHVFVGWGQQPYFSEFDRHGRQIFDGRFTGPLTSYRAYEFSWSAQPNTPPSLAIGRDANGISTAYASWNGATDVSRWRVLAGASTRSLHPFASVRPHGFETAVPIATEQPLMEVQALGSTGRVLGTSAVEGSSRSRVSIFGHGAFVSGGGVGGLQVGCFATAPCRLSGSLSAGSTKVATVAPQTLAAGHGGIVFFALNARGRKMLAQARSRRLSVSAGVRNSDGSAAFGYLQLVPYRSSGAVPSHAVEQGRSVRILAHTAFISEGGVGGIFTQCASGTTCNVSVSLSAGGRKIATAKRQSIAAEDCGTVFFTLNARGRRLLAGSGGNDLGALLRVGTGKRSALAHVSLVGYR